MKKVTLIKYAAMGLCLCLSFPHSLKAQGEYIPEGYRHYIALWAGGGYSRLGHSITSTTSVSDLTKLDLGTKIPGGYGALLGVGYQGTWNKLIFKVGGEFNYLNSTTKFDTYKQEIPYTYTPMGHDINYIYDFTGEVNNFSEQQNVGYVNIPLMAGYRFNDLFYAMLGVKYGIPVLASYKSKATFTTTAEDPQLIDILQNMPNHGIAEGVELEANNSDSKLSFGGNLSGSVEFGVFLDKWIYSAPPRRDKRGNLEKRISYRVALFADYGFLNINNNLPVNSGLMNPPTGEDNSSKPLALQVSSNPLFSTREATGAKVNPLFAGLKFTAAFDITPPKKQPPKRVVRPRFVAQVVDAETNAPIDAQVILKREDKGRQIQVMKQNANKKTGYVTRMLAANTYALEVSRTDYEPYASAVVITETPDTMIVALVHKPVLNIKVLNAETGEALPAEVLVSELATGKQIFKGNVDKTTGELQRTYEKGEYSISANLEQFITASANVNLTGGKSEQIIRLTPIVVEEEKPIVLKNLFFDFDKWIPIQPQSEPTLNDLYMLLKENPTIKIHIVGHTDNRGTDEYNDRLSHNRAKAVYDEMVKRGIDAARMTYEGKGKRVPVATNDTEEGRAENRRVEFTIVEK